MLLKFKQFLKDWDANEFCHSLALSARASVLAEMSMAGGEISKMKYLFDQDDWRFLIQFPQQMWTKALTWRYNEGLRWLMSHAAHPEDIPEGYDLVDNVKIDVGKNKKAMFGRPGGPKDIYVGLSKLAHKLTDPPKATKDEAHRGRAYWGWQHDTKTSEEGPSLSEIDPDQPDPTHEAHPSKYKHGLYNFDLSGLEEVTPEQIDQMSNYEMLQKGFLKPEKFGYDSWSSEEAQKDPRVEAALKKIREGMKKRLKHTFAGYAVPQESTIQQGLSNWIKANALETKLFGEHPTTAHDPNTNEEKHINNLTPAQVQAADLGHLAKSLRTGNFTIPTISKGIRYTLLDDAKGTAKSVPPLGEPPTTYVLPYLKPVKTLPQISHILTDEQKAQLAARSGYHWDPSKESYAQAKARYDAEGKGGAFELAASPEDLQKVLQNWDILTDEQKKYMKDHAKTPLHQAQVYHTSWEKGKPESHPVNSLGEDEGKDSVLPFPHKIYAAGFAPTQLTPGRPYFRLPQDKVDAFVDKYAKRMALEVLGGQEQNWVPGQEIKGPLDWFITSLVKHGKLSEVAAEVFRGKAPVLAEIFGLLLLPYLDTAKYGIKDPELGLLKDVPESKYDEDLNRSARMRLVQNWLASLAQKETPEMPSRRQREAGFAKKIHSLDAPLGDTGETGAAGVTGEQKPSKKVPPPTPDVVRRWYASDPNSMLTAGHLAHGIFSSMKQFFATKRNYVAKVLKSKTVDAMLQSGEENFEKAMQDAQVLITKLDNELKEKYPNIEEREKKLNEILKQQLPALLQSKYGYVEKSPESENIMTKALNNAAVLAKSHISDEVKAEMKTKMDKFFHELLTSDDGEARVPVFDKDANKFVEDGPELRLHDMQAEPNWIIKMIKAFYPPGLEAMADQAVKEIGPRIYDAVLATKDIEKSEDAAKTEFEKAIAQQTPVAPAAPAKVPMAAPTPAAPAPALAAAKPVEELLGKAGEFNNPQQGLALMNAILAKSAEIQADKSLAHKLLNAINAIHQRWMQVQGFHKPSTEEWQRYSSAKNKLNILISELS